jgi:general secretion pathway protein F
MARFAFEAIGASGMIVRGTLDAPSSAGALAQLAAEGQMPVSLRQTGEVLQSLERLLRATGLASFDYRLFLLELGVLLKAGMPVERALAALESISPSREHAARLGQILARVRAGEPLSQATAALVREAPAYVPRLIAAGEASGQLAAIVTRLAAGLARAKALKDKVISGLTYPAVLVVAIGVVLWVIFTSVLPRLTPMFSEAGAALPVATTVLLTVGQIVDAYGLLLLFLVCAAFLAFVVAMRTAGPRLAIDRFFLRTPLALHLPERYEAARFCRNLETLLDGGLSLERALAAARDGSANRWFRLRMDLVERQVAEGGRLRLAFAGSRVLPVIVTEFAAVGEETGHLGAMMGEAATMLDHDVETRLERLTSLVVPLATLLMGGLVAGIMAGVVSGILAVNDLAR